MAKAATAGELAGAIGGLLKRIVVRLWRFVKTRNWVGKWLNVFQLILTGYAGAILSWSRVPVPTMFKNLPQLDMAVVVYGGVLGIVAFSNLLVLLVRGLTAYLRVARGDGTIRLPLVSSGDILLLVETLAIVILRTLPFVWDWPIDPNKPDFTVRSIQMLMGVLVGYNFFQWARSGVQVEPEFNEKQQARIKQIAGQYSGFTTDDVEALVQLRINRDNLEPDYAITEVKEWLEKNRVKLGMKPQELPESVKQGLNRLYARFAPQFEKKFPDEPLNIEELRDYAWEAVGDGITKPQEVFAYVEEAIREDLEEE